MLTYDEKIAMDMTASLSSHVIGNVIGHGPSRDDDVREFVAKIHAIQQTIMAQSAAREHPGLYRLLGETI